MHWCTFLLALAAPVLSLPAHRQTTATSNRAVWLWNSDIILDSASISSFLSTATSSDNGFSTVYALIDRDMGYPAWQSFVAQCNAKGIAVGALMGDAQWILGGTTEDGPTLQHELDWITGYYASAAANAKFSSIHMDVEPYTLDGWEANKDAYVSSLLSIVDRVAAVAKPLNLPVAADLPFWSTEIACEGSTLNVCILNHLDSVNYMTYRNTPAALLEIATPLLKAVPAGKKIWLSVETTAGLEDGDIISYAGESKATLRSDLKTIEASASQYAGYGGIAVHDYVGFLALS